ncbi:MBL fold metallo-hydrolase [Oxalicibacterium solurbis]|uniref:MBL fold metallo-hydrolase n=1 Tax=Oxalicibacterium solurbis TaxID=69280 RepID=A0A8J3F853_9BURK|nr:MBL fold metallo-hydrolase [Oxalicibacterium solurbis]GGI53193.1 MBL fold metallo-hydrolase [Oxalicibacterium solurbis]
MKFASLGSGSEGNSLLISTQSGTTRTIVMLDCGFAMRETERRLARLQLMPDDISGIIVTHEHQDHIGGVFKLARRYRIPVWLTFGTYQAVQSHCDGVSLHFCRDTERFAIGDVELLPYTVPHDAREPVQYIAHDGNRKLGVLTDAGHATDHMMAALGGCNALMLECNHDRQMLKDSRYPESLKRRIGGDYGHLSNEAAAEILAEVDRAQLTRVVGAHLSLKNNTPELALAALMPIVQDAVALTTACQEQGFDWMDC